MTFVFKAGVKKCKDGNWKLQCDTSIGKKLHELASQFFPTVEET